MIISGTTVNGGINLGSFGKPDVPTNVVATRTSYTSVSISFDVPQNTGGTPITQYTVSSNTGISATGTTSPITLTGLTPGNNYNFTLYASTIQGNSDNSSKSNDVLMASTPQAPSIISAVRNGETSVQVNFSGPSDTGGIPITSYTAISTPGNLTATVTSISDPLIITGLSTNTSYTFKVYATNSLGNSGYSGNSNSVTTTLATSQQAYTTSGIYSWVCPSNVYSVSVVVVGGGGAGGGQYGGGGGGGGLAYTNNYPVTPGTSYTVVVGGSGSGSYWINSSTLYGGGGGSGTLGNAWVAGGGGGAGGYAGAGGAGGSSTTGSYGRGSGGTSSGTARHGGGAGGAGGYGGNGNYATNAAGSGTGGAAGGGSGAYTSPKGGGGVGLLGQGTNGTGGAAVAAGGTAGTQTNGGSGGSNSFGNSGGSYGGGSAGGPNPGVTGVNGAVRIIWPGSTRQFPSTNTVDM